MFPVLRVFGVASLPLQPILLACGVLAALAVAERLAARLGLQPERISTAAILGLCSIFFGERLILFAGNWRELIAHPLWMIGLVSVRDPRLFYAGAAMALAVCWLYLRRRRVSLRRAAAALLPASLLLLAFVHAGRFAVGAEPGRIAPPTWGIITTNRTAHVLYGAPLGTPIFPVAAWLSMAYGLLALAGAWAATRGRQSLGPVLLVAGLITVLAGQLTLRWPGQPMVLNVFTWPQTGGVLTTIVGALLLLRR